MITQAQLCRLLRLIQTGNEHLFYLWTDWRRLRLDVLKLDNFECQICKTKYHRHRGAVIVHHVKHLKDRPDLALSIWDGDERQLLSVCKQCHEDEHPESKRQLDAPAQPVTAERWD